METYKQYDDGTNVLETCGSVVTYNTKIPRINLGALVDLHFLMQKINTNSARLNTVDPYAFATDAAELDSTNLKQFLYKNSFTKTSRSVMDAAIRTIYGLEPNQLNTLFSLMYVKSGNSIEGLSLTEKDCAQEKRVKGGTQQISQRLLDTILSFGDSKAIFECPVVEINQEKEDLVIVKAFNFTENKQETFSCRKLISAIPINQYQTIKFKPELPMYKRNVFDSLKVGNYIKILVTYEKAFWKEKGYSGASVSDCSIVEKPKDTDVDPLRFPTYGPVAITFDGTTHEGAPALIGFICADAAVQWQGQSAEMRRKQVIAALVRYFGADAENYCDYFEKNWNSEPYNGGCPTYNVTTSSIMPDYARATREPFVNMHLCGTESATVWQGYMDGAVESGIRAANEVIYSAYKDEPGVTYDYEKTYFYHDEITRKVVNDNRKRSGFL